MVKTWVKYQILKKIQKEIHKTNDCDLGDLPGFALLDNITQRRYELMVILKEIIEG